jgi:hypothetical protein
MAVCEPAQQQVSQVQAKKNKGHEDAFLRFEDRSHHIFIIPYASQAWIMMGYKKILFREREEARLFFYGQARPRPHSLGPKN